MVSLAHVLELLHDSSAEVQCAAARVIGAMRLESPSARAHLLHVLQNSSESVRGYAMDALQKMGGETPLEQYAALLGGSPAITRKASDMLMQEGHRALPILADRVRASGSDEHTRAAMQTIQRIGSIEAAQLLINLIVDLSPDLKRFALDQFMAVLPSLSAPQRAEVRSSAAEQLHKTPAARQKETAITLLHLLGRMRDPADLDLMLSYTGRGAAPEVLSAAVGAIQNLGELPTRVHATVFLKLLPVLDSDNFDQIVKPALRTLEHIPPQRSMSPQLQKLNRSKHRSVRAYALRSLGMLGVAKSFPQLLEALKSKERKVVDAAKSALGSSRTYVQPLVAALRAAKTADEAWTLGRVLQHQRENLGKGILNSLASTTLGLIGSQSQLFQAYFELLRSAAPELLRQTFHDKGRALFLRKKYKEAADVLRYLDRHDLASGDSDLLLAMARVAVGNKDLTRVARDRHPGLLLLGRIARRTEFDVAASLKKIKGGLNPDDLLFAGFYLVERTGVDRTLGGRLLKFVSTTFRSSKAGRSASARLKTERIR